MTSIKRALAGPWDACVRVWLVLAAWVAVRRPAPLAKLARIRDPMRFVRAALVASGRRTGGPLAIAIAMLPRRRRVEATIAFVACRTLHAIDRLSAAPRDARRRVRSAVAYFVGEASGPSRLDTRGPRDFDAVLAARMALVRGALDELPGDAARRCCDIIERIGDGLVRARDDGPRSADEARGEAVIYAIRLAAPIVRPPVSACRAAGRVIPLARELRVAPSDAMRDVVLDRALPALAFVPRLLRWLPATIGPGTRAAMIVLALMIYPFGDPALATGAPRRLRHPLRAALAAACSRRAYLATAVEIEDVIHDVGVGLIARLDGLVRQLDGLALGTAQSSQPVPLGAGARLIAAALERAHATPELPAHGPRGVMHEAEREQARAARTVRGAS